MPNKRKKWYVFLFMAYCVLMLWLLFGQRLGQAAAGLNLKPLRTLKIFWWTLRHSSNADFIRHAVINLVGNVAMFVPLGFFVPCIWTEVGKLGWHCLCMVVTIVLVELLQLVTGLGTCDVDDLLLNLIGTAIGFGLFKIWKRINRRGGS